MSSHAPATPRLPLLRGSSALTPILAAGCVLPCPASAGAKPAKYPSAQPTAMAAPNSAAQMDGSGAGARDCGRRTLTATDPTVGPRVRPGEAQDDDRADGRVERDRSRS